MPVRIAAIICAWSAAASSERSRSEFQTHEGVGHVCSPSRGFSASRLASVPARTVLDLHAGRGANVTSPAERLRVRP